MRLRRKRTEQSEDRRNEERISRLNASLHWGRLGTPHLPEQSSCFYITTEDPELSTQNATNSSFQQGRRYDGTEVRSRTLDATTLFITRFEAIFTPPTFGTIAQARLPEVLRVMPLKRAICSVPNPVPLPHSKSQPREA